MRIVFATAVSRDPVLKALKAIDGIDLVAVDEVAGLPPHVAEADALIISDPRGAEGKAIAAELRRPESRVRWVHFLTAGVQGLTAHDLPDEIAITNQGGAVAPAVAEHGMALILSMSRRIPEIYANSARHEWQRNFDPVPLSLEGRTMVIVGYGNIGRQLAKRAKGFDIKVIGLSRSAAADPLADEMHKMSDMHAQLGRADVVAVCVASVGGTNHIIDAAAFAAMKKGAMFLNVTRGETVDQAALKAALESGHLRAAAIDVTTPEPLPSSDPLWSAPNLVISPHMAGMGGTGTAGRIVEVVTDNVVRFRDGRDLLHRVSP